MDPPHRPLSVLVAVLRGGGGLHGVDGRVDNELTLRSHLPRLLEEAKGEARRDAEPDMAVPPSLDWGAPIRRHLRGSRADLQEETAFVSRLPRPEILDLDGVRRHLPLVIEYFDLDEVRSSDLGPKW